MAKFNKKVTTVIKIVVSILLIYFIFSKINLSEIKEIIIKSSVNYLVIALFFFLISKIIAAFRLNLYFHQLEVPLTHKSNLELYLLGMFYNLFLPGGIGGDAYKGYILKKTFGVKTKKIISVLVLDRLCGLLLLFIYACGLLYFLELDILERISMGDHSCYTCIHFGFLVIEQEVFCVCTPRILEIFFLIRFSAVGTISVHLVHLIVLRYNLRPIGVFSHIPHIFYRSSNSTNHRRSWKS